MRLEGLPTDGVCTRTGPDEQEYFEASEFEAEAELSYQERAREQRASV